MNNQSLNDVHTKYDLGGCALPSLSMSLSLLSNAVQRFMS